MNEYTRNQKGSPARDEFKRRHKDLSNRFYACDLDFVFVQKTPLPDIVAAIDYKAANDGITFSEVIAYNALTRRGIPVFVVQGDPVLGRFAVYQYVGGHHGKPTYRINHVVNTADWAAFARWESSLRDEYETRYKP